MNVAAVMDSLYLPEELIRLIVINLPLKSMVRFRCVSKAWLSEVSHQLSSRRDRLFLLSQWHESFNTRVVSALTHGHKPVEIMTLSDYTHRFHPVVIVGSCNGLICAVITLGGITGDYSLGRRYAIILWNPATDKFKELPSSFENYDMLKRVMKIQHGFGYDASNDDYKVVESIFISTFFGRKRWLKIYSLNSNSWKFLSKNANPTIGMSYTSAVFVNGCVHWQIQTKPPVEEYFSILAVNLTTETCTIMAPPRAPPRDDDWYGSERLGVSDDHLCLAYSNSDYIDYWVMNEYGVERTWTKIMRVDRGTSDSSDEELEMSFKMPEYDKGSGKSLKEWSVETVCQFHEIPSNVDYIKFQCKTYRESLVSVSPPVQAPAQRREPRGMKHFILPSVFVFLAYCLFLLFDLYRSF